MNNKVTLGIAGLALALSVFSIINTNNATSKLDDRITDVLGQKTTTNNPANIVPPVNLQPENKNVTPQSNKQQPVGPTTSIKFTEEIHNFGNVNVGTDNPYSFVFTNTGKEPLLITNAKGSCGCTVPSWPKDPIMPGATGKIDVVYKPNKGQAGKPQEKTVTVTANTEPTNTIVRIKAMVNPE